MGYKQNYIFLLFIFCLDIKPVKIISLGQACSIAGAMRLFGIRFEAYPFDWLVSPYDALFQALSEDFRDFLREDSLTVREFDRYGILDHYGFHFVHDFPALSPNDDIAALIGDNHVTGGVLVSDWRSFLPAVKAKYLRRIDRFNKLLSSSEEVYFIRHHDTTKEQAIRLRDLMRNKYPGLVFILIVVGGSADMRLDWNLESIRNFYFDNEPSKEQEQWEVIFKLFEFEKLKMDVTV